MKGWHSLLLLQASMMLVLLLNCCLPVLSIRGICFLEVKVNYKLKLIYFCYITEFSLARSNVTAYANNSMIDVNLVGEGFEEPQITDGGALECHTDDTTCCRGIDNPNGTGRGEWYYPDGTVVPPPPEGGDKATKFYRTRGLMVVRLNRVVFVPPTGVYRCVIPGAGGVTIIRQITLSKEGGN